jgi:hypothetical protein
LPHNYLIQFMQEIIIDTGITTEELQEDLQNAMYMLHFLQEGFTQREIRDVCPTIKTILDALQERDEEKE